MRGAARPGLPGGAARRRSRHDPRHRRHAALWQRTTNPPGRSGPACVSAAAAGASLADLELVQFHPTALRAPGRRDGFLITEAVRGEGARLLDATGERFVDELAPAGRGGARNRRGLQWGRTSGFDLRGVDLDRFPNIAAALAEVGIDPRSQPIPVAPAAHYSMGSVATDLDGRSTVAGLYAVGGMRLHPASTARTGSRRTRSPSASCSSPGRVGRRRRAGRAGRAWPAASRRGPAAADAGHARRALAARRVAPRRPGPRRARRRPVSARSIAFGLPRARGEPRRAPARRLPAHGPGARRYP